MTPDEPRDTTSNVVVGQTYTLAGIRRDTKDGGDGGAILGIEVIAEHLPEEFAASATGTIWRIVLREGDSEASVFYGSRMPLKDMAGGAVLIRLSILGSDLRPGVLYGRRNACVALDIAMTAGHPEHARALDQIERQKTLRRASVHCGEPEFLAWIETEAVRRGYPRQATSTRGNGDTPTTEDRSSEYLCLLAQIHSRREIGGSARAANAVDAILRDYRTALWHEKRRTTPNGQGHQ